MNRLHPMHTLLPGALCALSMLPLAAHAADDEGIVTDRPDFVESSAVVGRGHLQLETGLQWAREREGALRVHERSTPTLLRAGLGDTLELRLESDGLLWRSERDPDGTRQTSRGSNDVAVGLKWHQLDGDAERGRPSVAWLLHAELPTGSAGLRGHGVRPSLRVTGEWELPAGWSLGVMPGIGVDSDDNGRRHAYGVLAASLGRDFTPQWHGFVELAAQRLAGARLGGNLVTLDTGLAWQPLPWLQLDAALFKGVGPAAHQLEGGLGVSVRY
jgi:hypothetical protein